MPEKNYHIGHLGGIKFTEKKEFYPLSHPQERELITEKTHPGTPFGSIPFSVRMKGNINYKLLEKAINLILYRNDGLRLKLVEKNYEYKQYISPHRNYNFDFFDFSSEFGKDRYSKWLKEKVKSPIKFIDNDLFYFAIIKWNDNEGGFFFNIHHIIADGWTANLIIGEILDSI